jgi:hypothetical protein
MSFSGSIVIVPSVNFPDHFAVLVNGKPIYPILCRLSTHEISKVPEVVASILKVQPPAVDHTKCESAWNDAIRQTETYHCNLILRGHVHHFYLVQAGHRSICATVPCWKARDDYSAMENPFVWMPQIGIVVIEVDSSGGFTVRPEIVEFSIQRPALEIVK